MSKDYNYSILGVDPGLNFVGLSTIKLKNINTILSVDFMLLDVCKDIQLSKKFTSYSDTENKIFTIYDKLQNVILDTKPNIVAIESPFLNPTKSPDAFKGLTSAITAIKVAVRQIDNTIPIYDYPPSVIKKAIKADKDKKEFVLPSLLKLDFIPISIREILHTYTAHEIDALSIAITHYLKTIKEGIPI